jgi:hypothetical protein
MSRGQVSSVADMTNGLLISLHQIQLPTHHFSINLLLLRSLIIRRYTWLGSFLNGSKSSRRCCHGRFFEEYNWSLRRHRNGRSKYCRIATF